MTNVLIIASDRRMVELRGRFQPLLGTLILMVNDFDLGLKEVFEKRPATVFIQDDINGVSGATVARHIKTLLRERSPRIVLVTDDESSSKVANSWFDDILRLSGSEQALYDAFKRHLDATGGLVWKDCNVGSDSPAEGEPAESEEFPVFHDNSEQVVSEPFPTEFPPLPDAEVSGHPQVIAPSAPELKRAALDEARAKLLTPGTLKPTGDGMQQPPPVQVTPPRYHPVVQPAVPEPDLLAWDEPVLRGESLNGRSLQGSRVWIFGAGFVVAVAIALFFYSRTLVRRAPGTSSTTAGSPRTPQEPARLVKLPSFITSATVDYEYGATHPGWERYRSMTGSMEYLVFREKGAIKALQMIALKDAVMDDAFIRTALRDLSGSDVYRVTSSRETKGFLIESGSVAGRVELEVYRKVSTSAPVALVISIP